MCGIAGILNLDAAARPLDVTPLRAMAAALVHRGPDDEGFYLDPQGRAGLAFRRLSIIDLAGGHQPMSNEDGTVWLAFNGEIYNFRALRAQLEDCGHRFATHSDAETIVHAYEQFGDDCFTKLAGMFAIAIWDQRRGRLLLARDRLGKKPLHYAVAGGRLYFGSEPKAIAALPEVPRRLDVQSLHRYLLFQYVPAPWSIYAGFGKLLPGQRLVFEAGRRTETRFWRVPARTRFDGSYDDAKRRLGELLTVAVEKRLVADVPLGAFLLGGIDSSIVVGLMRRLGASPLRTFSIGFAERAYDESAHARRVAAHFQTEHHEHVVTPRASEILDTLAYHYDEPFADSSAIPTWYVSQWARQSVTVALTGDAGDECFAGYDRYRAMQCAQRIGVLPAGLRRILAAAAGGLPQGRPKSTAARARRFLVAQALPAVRQYLGWVAIFPPEVLRGGYTDAFAARLDFDEPLRWFDGLFEGGAGAENRPGAAGLQQPGAAAVHSQPGAVAVHSQPGAAAPQPQAEAVRHAERAIYTDFESYLPYDLLTKVDTASMAVSLECRCPFLDHELVEFAVSLPLHWRLGRRGGKHILKDWAAELLPREILHRPKQGFGVPVGTWFRNELRGLLEERLLAADGLSAGIFRRPWLEQLLGEHMRGHVNHEHRLWALLMLELWARRWTPEVES